MNKTCLILLATALDSPAAVIVDTNISLSDGGLSFPPYDYMLTINQYPVFNDPTSIFFDRSGQSLIFRSSNLDEGSDWYFADFNDVFNTGSILSGSFTAFNTPGQSYNVGYRDFYFGVNTSFGMQPLLGRAIFGWALMRNTPSGLSLLGSGVSYDVPGIIVGTTTVPEPSAAWFLALAPVSMLLARRRKTGVC